MLAHHINLFQRTARFLRLLMILVLLAGCTSTPTDQPQVTPPPTATGEAALAEVKFTVTLLTDLADGQSLYIEIMDEVTGLALNPVHVKLEMVSPRTYTLKMALGIGSVIKYRYIRDNDIVGSIEYTSRGQQVRYRLYHVEGPGEVTDIVSAWRSVPFQVTPGRIQGQVSYAGSNAPVVNGLVTAGGLQTFTASDGTFLLEGLPSGTHTIVVYSLDGAFQTFQQGAVVAPESTTPAQIQVAAAEEVNVTFVVKPPDNHLKGVPIRLIGNTFALGNTFADLRGGVSVVASRAPIMTALPDGTYTLTLKLPAGLDLRYKYSLGDGFWNAELKQDGSFRLRQLVVPAKDIMIQDQVDTWIQQGQEPVSFTVTVPENTPVSDTISIQFNPYGWTEPIPMWPLGNRQWFYVLYSPLSLLNQASYRYCRNEQCGTADAVESAGPGGNGKPFSSIMESHKAQDTVEAWSGLNMPNSPVIVSASEVQARGEDFMAAIEFAPGYHPSWQPYMVQAFKNIKDIGANTVILTPSWRYTQNTPPVIEAAAGQDPFWGDLTQMVNLAAQQKLDVVVHPVTAYPGNPDEWWQSAARDDNWWQSWFDRYRTFLLYHADLAAQMGAKALILNDDDLQAALPGGTLADGSPSGVPGDAGERWMKLIEDVRGRFTGQLIWLVPMTGAELPVVPDFVTEFDQVYVRVSTPVSEADEPQLVDLENAFNMLLDMQILPLQEKTNQPVVFGIQYPSAAGSAKGCVPIGEACLPAAALYPPAIDAGQAELQLAQQADLYSAALAAVNQRSWIAGFVSSGYYPPVGLKDNSYSVRMKPAADVLWYWFPRMLGK